MFITYLIPFLGCLYYTQRNTSTSLYFHFDPRIFTYFRHYHQHQEKDVRIIFVHCHGGGLFVGFSRKYME